MKKGLFSILAGALLVVGCQNYDDQFSNLESQINALASSVAGLSQVQSDLSSLSGTVSSLSSTVAALGSQFDTAVSNGLADITADIAALQDALDGVASSSELDAVIAAVAAQQATLDELLANSSVYNGSITINSASTLDAFYGMGSTLAIVNGNVDIDVSTTMDIAKVQSVVDNILTVTGSYDYTAASSTVEGVTFNKLSGTATLTIKQNDGYELKGLGKATNIYLDDTWETGVDIVDLRNLSTVESINSQTASHTLDFTQAAEIHLTKVAYYGNDLTIKTKKGGVADLSALTDTNTLGVVAPYDLTLHNAASLTLSKFTGDASSTSNKGTVALTDVATVSISNFGGTIDLNGGVVTATLEDVAISPLTDGASDLTTLSVEGVRKSGKAYDALGSTAQALTLYTSAYPAIDLDAANADLTSVTLTGTFASINIDNNPSVQSVTINANSASLTLDQLADLSTVNVTGSKFNAVTVTNNTDITSLTLDYDKYTTVAATADVDAKGDLNVSDNASLESLTVNTTSLNNIDITTNAKLATVNFPNLVAAGTGTNADIDITGNKFIATSVTDAYDVTSAGVAISTGTTDDSTNTGTYTHSTGLNTLTTWLDAVIAAGTTADIQVWFDQIDELKVVSSSGTITTTNPGAITEAAQVYGIANGYYAAVYVYNADTSDSGRNVSQAVTMAIPLKRNLGAGNQYVTPNGDDIVIADGTGATKTFTTGTNTGDYSTIAALVAAMDGDTTLSGVTVQTDRDAFNEAEYQIAYTVTSTGAAATFSDETRTSTGTVYFTFGTNPEVGGTISGVTANISGASQGSSALASAIATKLNEVQSAFTATSTAYGTIQVVAQVSGTTEEDRGPLNHTFPDLNILVSSPSTTLLFAGSSYSTLSNASSNTTAIASSLFNLAVNKSLFSGIRVTLKNTSTSIAKTMTVGVTSSASMMGNTDGTAPRLMAQYLVNGTNIASSSGAGSNSNTLDYVATFAQIDSVTTTTDVEAQITDRTGWL